MRRRPFSPSQVAIIEAWKAELAEAEAGFRPVDAELWAPGARSRPDYRDLIERHLDAKIRLLNAQEWLASAEKGRPVRLPRPWGPALAPAASVADPTGAMLDG